MQDLIGRFLAPPPGVVLDVGGGPGRYACWLAAKGYQVHLIEARRAGARGVGGPAGLSAGERRRRRCAFAAPRPRQRRCRAPDGAALPPPRARATAGGAARGAPRAEQRLAALLDGICRGFIDDPEFVDIIRRDLAEGQHRGVPGTTRYFTTAFFHRPDQLASEIRESGFRRQEELFTVQGPAQFAPDLETRMADPARRAQVLDLIRLVEHEQVLLGAASHIACIAEKPAQDT